jgi:hypothetical protein
MSRSKLAKRLGLNVLPPLLINQWAASEIAGLRYTFIQDQIAGGQLPTVVMVPGLIRIHTDTLENWYEDLSSQCLADNKDVRWTRWQLARFLTFSAHSWLQDYAHAITTHAIKTGRLIREPCAFCGHPKSQAHHPSYDTPLRVVWLCSKCHPLHHHRHWSALKLIAKTGQPAQLELFPRSWLPDPPLMRPTPNKVT